MKIFYHSRKFVISLIILSLASLVAIQGDPDIYVKILFDIIFFFFLILAIRALTQPGLKISKHEIFYLPLQSFKWKIYKRDEISKVEKLNRNSFKISFKENSNKEVQIFGIFSKKNIENIVEELSEKK